MNIIKRSGEEKPFVAAKILKAIKSANETEDEQNRLSDAQINLIVDAVTAICEARDRASTVEEIQDLVETKIMEQGAFNVAKKYIT